MLTPSIPHRRFRGTYKISRLVRFILFELLLICLFSPMTIADLYTQPATTPLNPTPSSYYEAVMAPFVAFLAVTTMAIGERVRTVRGANGVRSEATKRFKYI